LDPGYLFLELLQLPGRKNRELHFRYPIKSQGEDNAVKWIIKILGVFAALLIVLMTPDSAGAGEPTPSEDDVNAVAKGLYCPVCENIPLDVCGTQACEQWRGIIRDKLREGWSEKQIHQYFVDQYGDRVLAEPPRAGVYWLVYLVPPLVFLAGVFLLFRGYTQWFTGEEIPGQDSPEFQENTENEEYLERLEEELRNR
jgi:cytochrome c-type biogenesis protein CcmH